jgi:DNA-binding NarL/FixJ family response regulator
MTSAFLSSLDAVSTLIPFRQLQDGALIPDSAQETRGVTDGGEQNATVIEPLPPLAPPVYPIRVLVVDDHEVVRKGLCTLLAEEHDFEVVGQAGTSSEVLALTLQHQPDIVLLDIWLGTTNALNMVPQLQRACSGMRIVVFTGIIGDEYLFRAMRLGVHAYLQKSLPLSDLLTALRAVHRGERVISDPHAITQILNEYNRLTKEQERLRSGLSDLEIELVRLAAEGCSNKEIAARQFWSEVTVKRKMQDIYRKLQATDRAQAVAEVMRMGLI